MYRLAQHRPGTATGSGVDTAGDDRSEHVLEALRSLPERQRLALSLRYLDEHSVAEVAEALGTTYRAAESVLARARSSFATAYRELS
jgi:RNA polymerase sigma factor (sigma-70 family)